MNENLKRSLLIFTIALITPFFVWLLLYSLAHNSQNAFDPSPWIQGFVEKPQWIEENSPDLSWAHVVSKEGSIYLKKNDQLIPLEDVQFSAKKYIFLIEAQGPSAAGQFYQFLKDKNLLSHSLVLAVSDGLLKDIRFYDGNLPLGAGQAYLVRYQALRQLALEGFMVINMSGVWLQPDVFKTATQDLTDAFQKMHVPVFIGPVNQQQIESLPKNANYLITESPTK